MHSRLPTRHRPSETGRVHPFSGRAVRSSSWPRPASSAGAARSWRRWVRECSAPVSIAASRIWSDLMQACVVPSTRWCQPFGASLTLTISPSPLPPRPPHRYPAKATHRRGTKASPAGFQESDLSTYPACPSRADGERCSADCELIGCGKPTDSPGVNPQAEDALFILRVAVGQRTCVLQVCDVGRSGHVTAPDARRERKTIGAVVSELARRALTAPPRAGRAPAALSGFRPFPKRGRIVTNEQVDKLREEDAC
jgi:hypothetical protein